MMSPAKKCSVCGDKALGYNFNAVTCESCKAFFRRNALAKKQFSCPFNQNCEITVVTRRFCQKCRLKKCLDIGMKSENIMSEEDKMIKRRKIESNREKRRLTDGTIEHGDKVKCGSNVKQEQQAAADSSGFDAFASYDSQSCGSFDSGTGQGSCAVGGSNHTQSVESSERELNADLMTGEEMVEFIVCDPDRACQAISKLMRTPREALFVLEKVISSQKDALRLIEHLIAYPGDALKIISKIMNSPFNALSVFTKFMSSPTDALEIISKIVSSPQDVLLFIKNLMDSPENAIDIMNKFMNTPAEALRIINRIFNSTSAAPEQSAATDVIETKQSEPDVPEEETVEKDNVLLNSMLSNSPSGIQSVNLTSPESTGAYACSPHALSLVSPLSAAPTTPGDLQLQSPSTTDTLLEDEQPSTSMRFVGCGAVSPTHIAREVNDLASEHFDLKTAAIHNQSAANAYSNDNFDVINSLDSVLTEVIRIEYQAFNEVPSEARIKQEYHAHGLSPGMSQQQAKYGGCQEHLPGTEPLQQSPPVQPICAPSSMLMTHELNETEQMKLRELRIASEALYYPVDDDLTTLMMSDTRIKPEDTHQDPKLLQVINLTAVAIKRLIKMAKKIKAFRDMCQEDQVALLKGGCTEMMIMRSVMSYDGNRNTWVIPHTKEDMSNIRAEVLKLAKGNVYEEHLKFIRTFDEKWRMDENIILIMCAIVLFIPSRPRIIHSDVIRMEQNSYYYLLRRYLESVYPGCEARSAFMKLIQKISDVERLNQLFIGVYLNVNPAQVEPLLREIFDLKNH